MTGVRKAGVVVCVAFAAIAGPVLAQDAAPSLQSMIDEVAAGSVIEVPAGTYSGPIVIDKPLTLRGGSVVVVDGGGSGDVFYVSSADVAIEGFTIRNTGASLDRENAGVSADMAPRLVVRDNVFEDVLFGVFIRNAEESLITGNVIGAKALDLGRRGDGIRLWESPRSVIEHNTIEGGRDTVMWFADDVVVRDNVIEGGRYGLHFMYSDGALIERNRVSNNSVGAFLMYSRDVVVRDNLFEGNFGPSGYGVGLKDMDGVTATGNHFIGNRVGLYLDNSPSAAGVTQRFDANVFAYNRTGVMFLPSVANNTLTLNAFIDNGEQVGVQGSGAFAGNTWTEGTSGNYWSDFAGYDADGDGVGDLTYRSADLFSELTDDHPELRFFDETPAARAIGLAAEMFPVFRPRPKLEDTAPLMAPRLVAPAVPGSADGSAVPGLAVGTGLVLVAALLAAPGGRRRRHGVA